MTHSQGLREHPDNGGLELLYNSRMYPQVPSAKAMSGIKKLYKCTTEGLGRAIGCSWLQQKSVFVCCGLLFPEVFGTSMKNIEKRLFNGNLTLFAASQAHFGLFDTPPGSVQTVRNGREPLQ